MYYEAGWIPLMVDPYKKEPPPNRTTGRHPEPTWEQIKRWIKSAKEHNIAIRIPPYMVGADVDAYKDGAQERLAELEWELGKLPPTWTSSARSDGVSGIRYFLIPPGLHLPGNLGTGIDIIQFRHRYAMAPPSVHPEGERYKWYAPGQALDGRGAYEPPNLQALRRGR